jgi:hypothetical protein
MKLNVLLAKTDYMSSQFKKSIADYIQYFKNKQGDFKGQLKTYSPRPGSIDIPNRRGYTRIVTTVDEKLQWFEETFSPYLDALFSQEATNGSGIAKAHLKVDGADFGELTSLELLKLKSILESGDIEQLYGNIPVRPDDEKWVKATTDDYSNRKTIYQSEELKGEEKTTEKESFILPDPNLKEGMSYTPQIAYKNTVVVLGDYTQQKFTGEWSHRERAELLRRRSKLLQAVVEALKIANEKEAITSNVTGKKIFEYLHGTK